jgi:hypothetical protein
MSSWSGCNFFLIMAGLVSAVHVFGRAKKKDVDARGPRMTVVKVAIARAANSELLAIPE